MSKLSVNIIYNKANTYGLTDDTTILERILKSHNCNVTFVDMREPLFHADINIHLEIPVFSAIPWAYTNIMLVNPEQWVYEYDAYIHAFDAFLFRDPVSADTFRTDAVNVIPWCNSWSDVSVHEAKKEFVCFVAGSTSKYEYMKEIVSYWKESDPPLTIYTTREDFTELKGSNITVKCEDVDIKTRRRLMASYHGHLVCSQGEAFGYAAANAETVGAFTIMNSLPAFTYQYTNGVAWLSNTYEESTKVRYSLAKPTSNIREELDAAFDAFRNTNFDELRRMKQAVAKTRFDITCAAFSPILTNIRSLITERKAEGPWPPILLPEDCPPISIITPTYNREKFIEIAFHNLLATDYPRDKIEWVVVEDNEDKEKMSSEKIISFQIQSSITLKYIPIEGRMSIGEKRNHGIENASNDIILFMDDDDHYPVTSFRRRVAWLLKGVKGDKRANIACCTTIALYDLQYGTSAVNVPPFDISFGQRISEATLTFRKSAWVERKFSDVSVAEGESWVLGREDQVIEMPPQQIIVAFSHHGNKSSRKIPLGTPSCFWGFPKEYLMFIHGLQGVEVE